LDRLGGERRAPKETKKTARYTALVWVDPDVQGILISLDEVVSLARRRGALGLEIWKAWKDRDMEASGFDNSDIPEEPGLYLMDITLFRSRTGKLRQQVNNIARFGLRKPKRWQAPVIA